jgi:hypothetical protein
MYTYIHNVEYRGQDGTLRHHRLYIPWRRNLTFDRNLNVVSERNELISLIRLLENLNYNNLFSKPNCHVVPKAFSISKNIEAVDMLLLKFKVTWSVSLIH